MNFKGKTVLITGGSRGIGRACSVMFADSGAKIGVNYISDIKSAEFVKDEIEKHYGVCRLFKGDISKEDEAKKVIDDFINAFGKIDILVNNAGIWKQAPIADITETQINETMNINLKGTFFVTKYAVQHMKKLFDGTVVNISSTAGQRGEAFYSHYAASKGAVQSFTKSLAAELAPFNIRVNCVAPGWFYTDMSRDILESDEKYSVISEIPLRRVGVPEEAAWAVLFLASELAGFITGEILNVNGGAVLCG
jgi:3-oxoacyl-[acyl-carrier protein] reductase